MKLIDMSSVPMRPDGIDTSKQLLDKDGTEFGLQDRV